MATALAKQIQCSVCWGDLSDPVSLPCEHSFCRQCIVRHFEASVNSAQGAKCPECRQSFRQEEIRASRPFRNMVQSIREHLTEMEASSSAPRASAQEQVSVTGMCPEHEEKLKLFCETDKALVCLICRDAKKHRGHEFTAACDAAKTRKGLVKAAVELLSKDNKVVDNLIQCQLSEIINTQERSTDLFTQITAQFEELHEFLRQKEAEVKKRLENETKSALQEMNCNLSKMENLLSNGVDNEVILMSALEGDQPDMFLQWWRDNGKSLTERVKRDHHVTTSSPKTYKSKEKYLNVTTESLFRGPYETDLQINVAREMMSVMKISHSDGLYEEIPSDYVNFS